MSCCESLLLTNVCVWSNGPGESLGTSGGAGHGSLSTGSAGLGEACFCIRGVRLSILSIGLNVWLQLLAFVL